MTTFFDQKEEVLQIELTQYGKHLLSRGKLKPAYYAFFDDDIIYDGKYSGIEETNAVSVERIKDTPRIKTQHVFSGIEEEVKKNLNVIKNSRNLETFTILPNAEKHYALTQRIGTSFLGDEKSPSFNVTALNGEFNSIKITQTGSMPNLKIPLLEFKDLEYKLKLIRANENSLDSNMMNLPITFQDGKSIYIEDDYLLIDITEENVEDEMKNFDIEMYMVENDGDLLIPLYFEQKIQNFKDGILLDPQPMNVEQKQYFEQINSQDQFLASNYFNILIDQEIEKNLICQLINNMKNRNISMYDPKFDCDEYQQQIQQQNRNTLRSLYDPSFDENDIKKC